MGLREAFHFNCFLSLGFFFHVSLIMPTVFSKPELPEEVYAELSRIVALYKATRSRRSFQIVRLKDECLEILRNTQAPAQAHAERPPGRVSSIQPRWAGDSSHARADARAGDLSGGFLA